VRHVELDAVEARAARSLRGSRVRVRDEGDVVSREVPDFLPPAALRELQEVNDLGDDPGGRPVVDPLREVGEARDEAILGEPQQRPRPARVDGHRLQDDQPRLPVGEPQVALADRVVDEAVLAREPRDHRGKDDAVREPHRADVEGLEEMALHPSSPRQNPPGVFPE
jgi:hypothetical protein